MSFWMHKARPLIFVESLPLWARLLAMLSVGCGLCFSLLIGIWLPTFAMLQSERNELGILQQQKKLFETIVGRYDFAYAQYAECLKKRSDQVFHYEVQKNIAQLLHYMQKHAIMCFGIQPFQTKPKAFFNKHYIMLHGRGNFKNIVAFLDDIEEHIPSCSIKLLQLDKSKSDAVRCSISIRLIELKAED